MKKTISKCNHFLILRAVGKNIYRLYTLVSFLALLLISTSTGTEYENLHCVCQNPNAKTKPKTIDKARLINFIRKNHAKRRDLENGYQFSIYEYMY